MFSKIFFRNTIKLLISELAVHMKQLVSYNLYYLVTGLGCTHEAAIVIYNLYYPFTGLDIQNVAVHMKQL